MNLTASGPELAEAFGLDETPAIAPRYNVAPSQDVGVIRLDPARKRPRFSLLRWGLVPPFAPDLAVGYRTINARAESVATKPSFREAFRRRRCLVPATGFYEWQKRGAAKQPFVIRRRDGRLFAFAGLWEVWRGPEGKDQPLETFTIVTTTANDLVAPIHDRMPVILAPPAYAAWLDPALARPAALSGLLAPAPSGELEAVPIGSRVNSPDCDDPEILRPVEPLPPGPEQKTLF